MSRLDDDGSLSSDIIAIEDEQQSLWVGVRPVWHGNQPGEIMVQICYQQHHELGPLSGPVFLTPRTWRELNKAVEWRLRVHENLVTRIQRKFRRQHGKNNG